MFTDWYFRNIQKCLNSFPAFTFTLNSYVSLFFFRPQTFSRGRYNRTWINRYDSAGNTQLWLLSTCNWYRSKYRYRMSRPFAWNNLFKNNMSLLCFVDCCKYGYERACISRRGVMPIFGFVDERKIADKSWRDETKLQTWEVKTISAASVPAAIHFVLPASFPNHADIEMNPKFHRRKICDWNLDTIMGMPRETWIHMRLLARHWYGAFSPNIKGGTFFFLRRVRNLSQQSSQKCLRKFHFEKIDLHRFVSWHRQKSPLPVLLTMQSR
jgi:hypothetical protein